MIWDLIVPTLKIIETLTSSAKQSYDDKRTYEEKLEGAKGPEVYKYVLLINISALEGYVSQARLQAQQSFNLSKFVSIAGFAIVAIAIFLSIYLTISGNTNLNAAYLAGIAGVITELISGVFFYLYSKTLSQINLFHDKLVDMQKTALSHIADCNITAQSTMESSMTQACQNLSESIKGIEQSDIIKEKEPIKQLTTSST